MPPSPSRLAVVIDQAAAPFAARCGIFATRDQARILDRDHGLIIVAIERPGLHLAFAAGAAVQELVERMQPVVAPRADVAQACFKFVAAQQRSQRDLHAVFRDLEARGFDPSALGEPSIRIGLVLLMWVKIRRPPRPASAASVPSAPSSGM